MMKFNKSIALLILSWFGFFAFGQAQITYDTIHFPDSDVDQVWFKMGPPPCTDIPGSSGASAVWDFTSCGIGTETVVQFRSPSSFPEGNLFPQATICYFDTLEDFRAYAIVDTDSVVIVGIWTDLGFMNNSTVFQTVGELVEWAPMALGDNRPRTFLREVWEPNLAYLPGNYDSIYLKSTINQADTIDGAGTISLPFDKSPLSFLDLEALRMKSWEHRVDSSFARDTLNGWQFLNVDIYKTLAYRWYSPFLGWVAAADMYGTTFDTVASYSCILSPIVGISSGSTFGASLSLSPNPVKDRAVLQLKLPRAGNVHIRVCDLSGRFFPALENQVWLDKGTHSLSFSESLAGLPSGSYIVLAQVEGERLSHIVMVKE